MDDWEKDLKETVLLCGGFACRLTTNERNEWHEFIGTISHWREYEVAVIRAKALEASGTSDVERIAAAVDAVCAAKETLYQIGKEWYAGLEKRREAIQEQEPC